MGDEQFRTDAPRLMAFATEAEKEEVFRWVDQFFAAPLCRECGRATGPRNERPLVLPHALRGWDATFGHVGPQPSATLHLFSEEFLSLLTPEERDGLGLRLVGMEGRRRFYELLGPTGPPRVALAGLVLAGWRCGACGHREWWHQVPEVGIDKFVARTALPGSGQDVFTVGVPPNVELAVRATLWRELVGRRGTRGMVSRPLCIAPPEVVAAGPSLPLLADLTSQ